MSDKIKGAEGHIPFMLNMVTKADDYGDDEDIIIEGMANTTSVDRAGDLIPRSAWEKAT